MRVLTIRASVVVLVAGLWLGDQASPVPATPYHPTGDYAQFGDCPLASPHKLGDCVFATVNGGSVAMGRKTVPVNGTITIQGGFYKEAVTKELVFVGAEDGNTLSSTPLSITGGLSGLIPSGSLPSALQAQANASQTSVTVTLQLARPAGEIGLSTQNIILEEGVALRLPLKMKLNNQFLGSACYIGSSSNPVVLSMTTGLTSPPAPNRPIEGGVQDVQFLGNFAHLGAVLVDNSFQVPEATGCGGASSAVVDRTLDAAMGLPSPAGRNTAILDGTFMIASPTGVRESE